MRILGWIAIGLAVSAGALRASDPKETYESLYGTEAKNVAAKDCAAFANRLLKDSAQLKDQPDFAAYIVDRALEFFSRAQGGEDRTAAGSALMDQFQSRGDARLAEDKTAEALRAYQQAQQVAAKLQSPRAAEIATRIKIAQGRVDVLRRAAELQTKVAASPDDYASAKALVLLMVVEMDRPRDATKYLAATGDELLQQNVPMAAGKLENVPIPMSKDMGDWYKGLAATASPTGKLAVYTRAKSYYDRFIAGYDKQDAAILMAKKSRDEVGKELDKLASAGLGGASPKEADHAAAGKGKTELGVWAMGMNFGNPRTAGGAVLAPRFSSSFGTFWDFKKDGVLSIATFGANRGGRVSADPTPPANADYVNIETQKYEIKDNREVVGPTGSYEITTFPLPLNPNGATGDVVSRSSDSNAVTSKRMMVRVPDETIEKELAKFLAEAKASTKLPGVWAEDAHSNGQTVTWMFCDSGTAVCCYRWTNAFGGAVRSTERYVKGKCEIKGGELLLSCDNRKLTFPYPLDSKGTDGKAVEKVYMSDAGETTREVKVKLVLQPKD